MVPFEFGHALGKKRKQWIFEGIASLHQCFKFLSLRLLYSRSQLLVSELYYMFLGHIDKLLQDISRAADQSSLCKMMTPFYLFTILYCLSSMYKDTRIYLNARHVQRGILI